MNNYQWLLQMDGADRKAWFDAEHVENQERALDGDTEPENEDTREQLEADIEVWASIMDLEDQIDTIHGWLNRRAAILEREMVKFNRRYFDCVDQEKKIVELTAERDNLKANNEQLHTLAGEQAAKIDEFQSALDAICANLSIIVKGEPNVIADIAIETIEELIDECNTANRHCNEYRSKFGKCLDYADAIHALMDDEGMA